LDVELLQIYVAPPDEATRQQIINKQLEALNASKDSAEFIFRRAMEVVNATPAILCDLCDQLNALLSGRRPSVDTIRGPAQGSTLAPALGTAQGPAVSVRQRRVDDVIDAARQKVIARKDSIEACAANWIDRTRRDGL